MLALRVLQAWRRRSPPERMALAEAAAYLAVARLALAVAPFQWLARFLGEKGRETTTAEPRDEHAWRLVAQAVVAAARHTPWDSRCFAQALAATAMLRRRGLPSTTYFGVARDDGGRLLAHAWVRCGPTILCGGPGHDRYTVVATFASGR